MIKTVTVSQLYKFIQNSNMMGYIESEAALIRVIKKMTEGRPGSAICFHFVTTKAKSLVFKVHLKDLDN
jgi:hypothetical protein